MMKLYFTLVFLIFSSITVESAFNVSTCEDVLAVYKQVGYPVVDCLVQDAEKEFPLLIWRMDAKLSFADARAACKTVTFGDLATVHSSSDLRVIASLNEGKYILNSWLWIGATGANGNFTWVDGAVTVPLARFYPGYDSKTKGNCLALIKLGDPEGENDGAGTFYYSEDCESKFISACFTTAPPET